MNQPLTTWQAAKVIASASWKKGTSTLKALASHSFGNTQGYEGAARSRRLSGWSGTKEHVNSLLVHAGETLVSRSRYLTRNSPYISKGKRSFVANAIGAGIVPISQIKDLELRKEVDRKFLDWTDEADADGLTDFYGLQALACGSMFEAGECFIRFRPRRLSDGLTVPLQLQLLESEQLPLNHFERLQNGNVIRSGIEFNRLGKRVAYHFLKEHPGDRRIFSIEAGMTVRVPAVNVLHLYEVIRPGQIRGQVMLAAAMVKAFLLDIYDDAEIDRKKVAALFTGFLTRPADVEGSINEGEPDEYGVSLAELSPGTMNVLNRGEEVTFAEPADVGGNYEVFQRRTQLAVCAAMNIPYENGTGDLRNVSYSSIRAGVIEFRRCLEQYQHQTIVYQMCRPVRNRWFDDAVLSDALVLPDYINKKQEYRKTEWIPDQWDWIDPVKDRKGEQLARIMGNTSRTKSVRKEGYDINEINEEIASEREEEKRLGISFGPQANEEDEDENENSSERQQEEAQVDEGVSV